MGKNAAIISRALDGDALALEELCAIYGPRLRAYFRKHGLARADIDDALQETWARLIAAIRRKRVSEDGFEGWLFTTARNVRVDHIRLRRRSRCADLEEATAVIIEPEPAALERREERATILRAIEDLPLLLRRPLVLRHEEGLTYQQIADRLGITANTVGIRIHRARGILKEWLHDLLST